MGRKGSDCVIRPNLLATVTGPQHTVTNTWEPTRNVLATKENELTGGTQNTTLSKFTYTVNEIGQRVGLAPTGSAFATTTPFVWGYNARGELTSATRNGLTPLERSYTYDGIGNRLTATDHNAATTSYFADTSSTDAGGNALNQYEKIEFPGSATIQPIHDADGNMTSGPVPGANGINSGVPVPANASLTWDGENRLISATVDSTTVNYLYDAQSRLISKSDDTSNPTYTVYLYDGWNRIAEYEKNGSGHELKRTYLWGMDLSGSMQGAGGVGGLLAMTVHDTTIATFYPTYDGNGNISEYINDSGAKVAHFNPLFPALRSGHRLIQRPSRQKQIPSSQKLALKAGRLLLHEIDDSLISRVSIGLESTLSGTTHAKWIHRAKSLGYQIELHYLWGRISDSCKNQFQRN